MGTRQRGRVSWIGCLARCSRGSDQGRTDNNQGETRGRVLFVSAVLFAGAVAAADAGAARSAGAAGPQIGAVQPRADRLISFPPQRPSSTFPVRPFPPLTSAAAPSH